MTADEASKVLDRPIDTTNANGAGDGYLVAYEGGTYKSWSPKDVFDEAYRRINAMTFGLAIEAMKKGKKVARAGWNGKAMFVYLVKGGTVQFGDLRDAAKSAAELATKLEGAEQGSARYISSHIDMKAADGSLVIGWLASQTDILAEDWEVIE